MPTTRSGLTATITTVVAIVALALPALAGGRPLSADLNGDNEVPASGSEATGTAHFTLNQGRGEICVVVESSGYDEGEIIVAGHIHAGGPGVNMPPLVDFGVNAANFSNCVDVDPAIVKDIRQNPSDYYFNLHTNLRPGGVIRDQLSK
ncbi:MAG: CHRD domain-containing protein [Acidimicrobiia bacterium]